MSRRRPDDIYACPSKINPAASWIAREIIGNEIQGLAPLPASARDDIARAMVQDDFLGWPDLETAQGTLDEWKWDEE